MRAPLPPPRTSIHLTAAEVVAGTTHDAARPTAPATPPTATDAGTAASPTPAPAPAARVRRGGLSSAEDAQLVAWARDGYLAAFEELVRRHQRRAYTLAARLCGDRTRADDITQEAFLRAWKALGSFDGRAAFSTWLHRIVVNAARHEHRWSLSRPTAPLSDAVDPASSVRTERLVEERARDEALHRVLRVLPVDQRAALVLTAFMDCTYEEAASILEVSEPTLRGRVARARRTVATAMEEWA